MTQEEQNEAYEAGQFHAQVVTNALIVDALMPLLSLTQRKLEDAERRMNRYDAANELVQGNHWAGVRRGYGAGIQHILSLINQHEH